MVYVFGVGFDSSLHIGRSHMTLRCRSLRGTMMLLSLAGVAGACSAALAQKMERPCDIYAAKTKCVAAMSTTRALYRDYKGPLYQVTRTSDQKTMDVGLLPDGYAKAAEQDAFCGQRCTITKI